MKIGLDQQRQWHWRRPILLAAATGKQTVLLANVYSRFVRRLVQVRLDRGPS